MKLYSLSNFDRLYLRQYRSYEQTSKHRTASFWPEKGFGTSLGCHRYFSMTQLPLQVKRTVRQDLETSVDFRFLPRVWCSMLEIKLHWAREERCFQSCIGNCEKCQAGTEDASGSCEKSILPVSLQMRIKARWCERATTSSIWHLSQISVPQWGVISISLASAWHSRDARIHVWKHFLISQHGKAKDFLSSMEHQTLGENLKLTEVSISCHIYGLLFYGCNHWICF
jgi:hypothetical protein